jgi:hypothetical protein
VPRIEDKGAFVFRVAGVSFRMRQVIRSEFAAGMPIVLIPDPKNAFDPHAVGVWDAWRRHQVGFVPAAIAPQVAQALAEGRLSQAICTWEWLLDSRRVGITVLAAPGRPIPYIM